MSMNAAIGIDYGNFTLNNMGVTEVRYEYINPQ